MEKNYSTNFSNKKQINYSLNFLKTICIFAVICIHCMFYKTGPIGASIDALSRFAVPVFFLISGFYSYYKDNDKAIYKYKTRIIRLIKLIIISNVVYFIFFTITRYHWDIFKYITKIMNKPLIDYIVFNLSPTASLLWFLQALLYCYIIFLILCKINFKFEKLYVLIPILLIINLLLGEIGHVLNFKFSLLYSRNFLFMGLPFFILGYMIHDKQEIITNKISNDFILLSILPLCALTVVETLLTGKSELYIGSIFLSSLLFIWCIKNPDTLKFDITEWIGGKLYILMYVLHYLIIQVLKLNLGYFNPIIIFIVTAIVSSAIYWIIQELKNN